jgi:hypothetical protein
MIVERVVTKAEVRPQPGRLYSVPELLARPRDEYQWLVENRLRRGGVSILGGRPKAGKSTLARCLAASVVNGEPWLGSPTKQGPVVYFALEEQAEEVSEHFLLLEALKEELLIALDADYKQDNVLAEVIKERKPALVIVDPLVKLVRVQDFNDYATVYAALNPILELARTSGAHVMALHHTGKSERNGGDALLGSTALSAVPDAYFIMDRSGDRRSLMSEQRSGVELKQVFLDWNAETRRFTLGEAVPETPYEEVERRIAAALNSGEHLDTDALYRKVGGRKAMFEKTLIAMVNEGTVRRTGAGKKGDPYLHSAPAAAIAASESSSSQSTGVTSRLARWKSGDDRHPLAKYLDEPDPIDKWFDSPDDTALRSAK